MPDMDKIDEAARRTVDMLKSRIEIQMGRQRGLLARQAAYARGRIGRNEALRLSERMRMAENLERIIAAACARPDGAKVTRSAIAAAAGMSDGNGKSGRLYDYTLDPDAPEEKRRERAARRLVQKPRGYLSLAEAAVRPGGLDADRSVVDLVQGTRLAEGMDQLPDEVEPEHLTMLADAIQGEARRIAEATGLAWYFETVDRHGLTPTGDGWGADHEASLWTYLTVPGVELFTEQVAAFQGTWTPRRADGSLGEPQAKMVWVCRRVALALAPFGERRSVRAYLVRHPVLVLATPPRPEQRWLLTHPDFGLGGMTISGMPDPEGRVYARHGTLEVEDADAVRSVAVCPPPDSPGDDHEFLEVTASNLASVLETGLPGMIGIEGDALALPAAAYTKSPPGSRSADLERALLHGQHYGDGDTRLMVELEGRARVAVEGLRAWIDARNAEIEQEMTRMSDGGAR